MTVKLTESTPLVAPGQAQPEARGRIRVNIISAGWGSSGYYSGDVLEAAGKEKVFPAGTHMYINHPGATESYDRPERDLKDLAAVLTEDGTWDGTHLSAEADVFPSWREPLSAMAPHIGVSIRGSAEVSEGSAEGRTGVIIDRLVEGSSVDFVTHAGRGGSYEVLESAFARGHAAQPVEEATYGERRDLLTSALRDSGAAPSEEYYLYVRDFDETTVWFEVEGESVGLFGQTYTLDSDTVVLSGSPFAVTVNTQYVPVVPAGSTQESEEDTMPQIEEARLRQLETDASRATELENKLQESEARSEQAELQLAEARKTANAAKAEQIVAEAFKDVTAPKTAALLVKHALSESEFDAEELQTTATEAAAELAESQGAGSIRGLGESSPTDDSADEDISEADLDARLAAISGRTKIKEG